MSNQEYCDDELIDMINSPLSPSKIRFFLKIFLLDKASSMIGSIAIVLLFSQNVLAQSFAGYCISAKNETNLESKTAVILPSKEQNLSLSVSNGDRSYQISLDPNNKRKVLLRPENQQNPIDKMILAQAGGQIKNLTIGQDNWLWIDRYAIDYLMKVNFSASAAYFESPIKLPELSAQPCHLLRRLFKKCQYGQYSYSSSLNRVFVSGYPIKSWRKQKYIHLEFISGNKHPVPELLQEALFVADIPQWNGALFKLPSGEALFYDGQGVTNLSQDFRQLANGENFQDWEIRQTTSGRSFIGNFTRRKSNDPLFLMELTAKPGFKPIYLPEDFEQKWLEIFIFADDPEQILWIISRKSIYAQMQHRVKTIVKLPSSFFIKKLKPNDPNSTARNNGNYLEFAVRKDKTKLITNYSLREIEAENSCEMIIDLEKTIMLEQA